MEAPSVRQALLDDARAANELFNDAYGRGRTEDQWLWEFAGQSEGGDLPYAIAEQEGVAVGIQGMIPISMTDSSGEHLSCKSEDTLVHESMRGKGVFSALYDLMFEWVERHGVGCIWGFTPATGAFERLGFVRMGDAKMVLLPLRPSALLTDGSGRGLRRAAVAAASVAAWALARLRRRFSRQVKPPAGLEIRRLFEPPAGSAAVTSRFVRTWGGVTLTREARHLKWRVFDNPHTSGEFLGAFLDGELVGWAVVSVRERDRAGFLVDLVVGESHPDRRLSALIAEHLYGASVRAAYESGAVSLRSWTVTSHAFDTLLYEIASKLGAVKAGLALPFVVWFNQSAGWTRPDKGGDWYVTRLFSEGLDG